MKSEFSDEQIRNCIDAFGSIYGYDHCAVKMLIEYRGLRDARPELPTEVPEYVYSEFWKSWHSHEDAPIQDDILAALRAYVAGPTAATEKKCRCGHHMSEHYGIGVGRCSGCMCTAFTPAHAEEYKKCSKCGHQPHNGTICGTCGCDMRAFASLSDEADRSMTELQKALDESPAPAADEDRNDTPDKVLDYATRLAVYLHDSHYPEVLQWKPLGDIIGVLSQIDNMITDLQRTSPAPAAETRPSPLTEVPEHVRSAFKDCDSGNYEPRLLAALNAYIAGPSPAAEPEEKPKIVCLCGSTRFWKTFQEKNLELTKEGCIVLSIGAATASDTEHLLQGVITAEDKARFDELHLRKIDLANEVLVLNVGGYIGESTAKEIDYAKRKGKLVFFLEDPAPAAETAAERCESNSTRDGGELVLQCVLAAGHVGKHDYDPSHCKASPAPAAEPHNKTTRVTIFVDGTEFLVPSQLQCSQVMALVGKDAQYQLFKEMSEGEDFLINAIERIELSDGDRFYTLVSGTYGTATAEQAGESDENDWRLRWLKLEEEKLGIVQGYADRIIATLRKRGDK